MPEVAVVIPAYNAAATIGETLGTLASQTHGDFEAIVVDDGSGDSTALIAGSTGDPRIRVVQVPNGGVANARNHGIRLSDSRYVAFLDADDLWHREKLERQLGALRGAPGSGMCVTGAVRIDARSRELEAMPLLETEATCEALLLNSMMVGCLSSGLVRRDVLDQVGWFDPRFSQAADYDLWLRLSTATRFVVLSDPLVRYRSAPGNMSSNPGLLERDTFAVLDAFFARPEAAPLAALRRRTYGAHWLYCSGSYLHAGRRSDAARCLANALLTHPSTLRSPLTLPLRRLRRRKLVAERR